MSFKLYSKRKQTLQLLAAIALAATAGMGCNTNITTTEVGPDCTNCSTITPDNFVAALVSLAQSGQIAAGYAGSKVVKDPSLKTGWFVIWDGATQSYMAVDISGTDLTSYCSQDETACSNINPTAAAQAFAADGNAPVYKVTSETSSSGTFSGSSSDGTIVFGSYSGSSATATQVGTYTTGSFGSESADSGNWVEFASGDGGYVPYPLTDANPSGESVTAYSVAPSGQTDSSGAPIFQDTYGDGMQYSVGAQTKDVSLQASQAQNTALLQQAAQLSAGLQMDFNSAIQLTQLAQKIQTLQSTENQLTSADRDAISSTLLGIAGVTQDEVNQAIQGGVQGDMTGANALLSKISQNLGMPENTLRNQILPKLGVNLN